MNVLQTPTFKKQIKKLHRNQKQDLDAAIQKIMDAPSIGEFKKGNLSGIQVYKFKMVGQLMLLAYEFYDTEITLVMVAFGSHENFYRDLRK